jgi:thiamine biosynthesis lipoprotein
MKASMRRRHCLLWATGAVIGGPAAAAALQWRERALLGFGTTLHLRAGHADGAHADAALDDAVGLLRRIEQRMSLFRADGDLVRFNRDGVLHRPDPLLLDVMQRARGLAARSGGAFDPTVQPLWRCWQAAAALGRRPHAAELAQARSLVGWQHLRLSADALELTRPGMAVTLNGIAQGYAAQRVQALFAAHGIRDALIDTGEWAPMGASPEGAPWQLGLADPRDSARILATLRADGRPIAVSSDSQLSFSEDRRHHHILDPRSGESPPHLSAVVVAAQNATLADALTKVFFMGTAGRALTLAARWGVDVIVVDKGGRIARSRGWRV